MIGSLGVVVSLAAATFAATCSEPQTPAAMPSGSAASLGGRVVSVDAQRPVGGGVVEVLSGSAVARTAPVGADGIYAFAALDTGVYTVRLQPPLTHSMGSAEPAARPVKITQGVEATVNFVVQPALYADDFQSYASIADITYGTTALVLPKAGRFGYTPTNALDFVRARQTDNDLTKFALEPNGGPFNDKAFRYDWPARPTSGPNDSYYTREEFRIAAPTPANMGELWFRWTDKLSSNFRVGGGTAVGSQLEYKYFFINVSTKSSGSSYGQFQIEMEDAGAVQPSGELVLRAKIIDVINGSQRQGATSQRSVGGPGDYALGGNLLGKWHTWVVGITGMGTATTTLTIYIDGGQVLQISGPWFPNEPIGGAVTDIVTEMGANINNGPNQVQSRWWREIGVYTSRPSLKPLVSP